jgi:hypothetical protein
MPVNKREQILERLKDIMSEEYIQAETVVRNRGLIEEDARPAIAIMDGDERAQVTGDSLGRGRGGRVGMSFQLMTMAPQVFFIPKELLPRNQTIATPPVNIGTIVNEYADLIVRVVARDTVLQALVGNNGSIAYIAMVTDLKSGAALQGQCRLDFAFTYMIDPSEPL